MILLSYTKFIFYSSDHVRGEELVKIPFFLQLNNSWKVFYFSKIIQRPCTWSYENQFNIRLFFKQFLLKLLNERICINNDYLSSKFTLDNGKIYDWYEYEKLICNRIIIKHILWKTWKSVKIRWQIHAPEGDKKWMKKKEI